MKRLFAIAFMLFFLLPLGAQELTLSEIEDTWMSSDIPVVYTHQGKPNIGDFATAFCKKYRDNGLVGIWYDCLSGKRDNEDVAEFNLDTRNGYVDISLVSDATVAGQMCFWNLPDGRQRVGVKLFNYYELPRPILLFYDYYKETGSMTPELVVDHMPDFARCGFSLPQKGKDIQLFPEYEIDGEAWLRYDGLNGFRLDAPDNIELAYSAATGKPIVDVYLLGEGSWVNVRKGPTSNSEVVAKLSPEQIVTMILETPKNGWWHIQDDRVYPAEEEDDTDCLFLGGGSPCWIHNSVVGFSLTFFNGMGVPVYAQPSWRSEVIATIKPGEEEPFAHPLDVSSDGGWVKIVCGKVIGWIRAESICSNPLTTCA